jgi:HEAT repeat protein
MLVEDNLCKEAGDSTMTARSIKVILVLLLAAPAAPGQSPAPTAAFDETSLRQAGVGTDAAALLKLLREHTRNDADPKKVGALIERLGSPKFEEREAASKELVAAGRAALDALRKAREDDADPEIRLRAGFCVSAIENSLDPNVAFYATRRLIHLRAEGAAGPLLTLLPDADWEMQDEIFHGLHHVALRDGKLDPAVLAALADKSPARRAAAALTVARLGAADDRARVRKLLADPDAHVRLRAAQGLLAAHDPESLPVLIALLNEQTVEVSWSAEELLHWAAGGDAPLSTVGAALPAERKKVVEDWTAWHKDHAAAPDWDRIEKAPRRPALYLVCDGQVRLYGCDSRPRWVLPHTFCGHDALLLPDNEILVTSNTGDGELIKRTITGKEVWKYVDRNQDDCVALQRLPNGRIFATTEEGIVELSAADGSQASAFRFEAFGPCDGWKLRNGRVFISHDEGLAEVDGSTGRVIRNAPAEKDKVRLNMMNKIAVLADGRCVLPDYRQNRLVEVDAEGRPGRTIQFRGPWGVEALRNGNYLVTTMRDNRVVEITPDGRSLWEAFTQQRAMRARAVLDRVRIGFDRPRPADYNIDSLASRLAGLKDADPQTRRRSAIFLSYLKPTDDASVAALITALDDQELGVRNQAAQTLAAIGDPVVPPLVATLRKGTPIGRSGAANALNSMGAAAAPAVPELVELIRDGKMDPEVRRNAARTLGSIGPGSKPAVPALLELLKCDDDQLRQKAALSLPAIAPDDEAVVKGLVAALRDTQYPSGRLGAARAVATIGPKAKAAVPDLIAAVRSSEAAEPLRTTSVEALGSMTTEASAAVTPLVEVLKDGKQPENLRITIAVSIGHLGPESKAAIPVYVELLRDAKVPDELGNGLLTGLTAMGKEGVPALGAAAKGGGTPVVRRLAIDHLIQLREACKPALDDLKEAMKDADPSVSGQATRAVRMIEQGFEKGGRK